MKKLAIGWGGAPLGGFMVSCFKGGGSRDDAAVQLISLTSVSGL